MMERGGGIWVMKRGAGGLMERGGGGVMARKEVG